MNLSDKALSVKVTYISESGFDKAQVEVINKLLPFLKENDKLQAVACKHWIDERTDTNYIEILVDERIIDEEIP